MREDVPILGAAPATPLEEQPAPQQKLSEELGAARNLLAQKMGEGFAMDQSPLMNPNLCFGLHHDGLVIDTLMDLMISKGVCTKEEIERGLLGKIKERIVSAEQHNAALRHRIVIAQPGKG